MASSVGRVCAGVFVIEATSDTEVDVDVEASTAQEDEGDDGYGYGGEMITDTRPLRARAHRPRQAVTIRRDQACPHGARRPARGTAGSAAPAARRHRGPWDAHHSACVMVGLAGAPDETEARLRLGINE